MKTRMMPETMPGMVSGTVTLKKVVDLRGAEIEARLEEGAVEPLDRRIERQHHERHVDIDEAEDHRAVVVEHLEGAKPDPAQHQIDIALACGTPRSAHRCGSGG